MEASDEPYIVSAPLDAAELQAEYGAHESYQRKAKQLVERGYTRMRRCRRDGNCFFRAFAFGYLEHALASGTSEDAKQVAQANFDTLATLYPPMVFEDFHELLLEALALCVAGDRAGLEAFLADASTSDCIVSLLRFVTAAEIVKNEEQYQPFLPDGHTAHSFTQNEVLNMGRESEEVHLVALARRMGTNLRVLYMDAASPDLTVHDFFHAEPPAPHLQILYRPGHYDILYGSAA